MAQVIDTNILVRQADSSSADRPVALQALRRVAGRGEILNVVPQNMIEFWVVATRPLKVNGLGLSIMDAEAERVRLGSLFLLLPDPPDLYLRWISLVNQFGISGKPAHDARIVAAMLAHGITEILTFNGGDFQRFAPIGIVVIDPAKV